MLPFLVSLLVVGPSESGALGSLSLSSPGETLDATGGAKSCSRILPPFQVGVMDTEPALAEPNLVENEKHDEFLRSILLNRSTDSPLGVSMSSEPLLGGVLAAPTLGANPLDLSRFDRVMREAASNSTPTLNVLLLGGSMTSGRMQNHNDKSASNCWRGLSGHGVDGVGYEFTCFDPLHPEAAGKESQNNDCKPCAYGARFESWLKAAYPHKKVSVFNIARGGQGSTACVGMLGGLMKVNDIGRTIDVVITNFAHNDGAETDKRGRRAMKILREHHKGEAVSETTEKKWQMECKAMANGVILRDHEVLLRELLSLPKKPAVLEMELAGGEITANGLYPLHQTVMEHYQVPAISWQRSGGHTKFNIMGHPSWPWHQFIADWLAYTWSRLADHSCRDHPSQEFPLDLPAPKWATGDSTGFCSDPLTFIDAKAVSLNVSRGGGSASAPVTSTTVPVAKKVEGNWTFGEDHPSNGKPGWWMDDPAGGKIVFEVSMSKTGSHTGGIGYLSSWHPSMGAAWVSLEGDPAGWGTLVNASNGGHKISTTDFHRLCTPLNKRRLERAQQVVIHQLPVCAPMAELIGEQAKLPKQLAQRRGAQATTKALLQVEVLPRPGAQRNKFVVRYISTC